MRVFFYTVLVSLVLAGSGMDLSAQPFLRSEKQYLNPVIVNPAIAGSEFDPVLNISASKTWLGITGSPSTQMLSTSLRIGNFDFYNPKMFLNKTQLKAYEKIGLGLVVYNNQEGPVSNRGAQMAYAYHVPFMESRLSFGLAGTYNSFILDQSLFKPVNPMDPGISYSKEAIHAFNANIGIYYYTPDYFTGLSALNLFPGPENYNRQVTEFSLQAGYIFKSLENIMLEPSLFLNYNSAEKLSYDLYTKLYFLRLNWVALGYHSYEAFSISTGLKIRRIYICYSVRANLSKIMRYNAGSHEIGLGLNLGTRRLEGF
jgi:type IX secretion system PorP/SprF family membrane protein